MRCEWRSFTNARIHLYPSFRSYTIIKCLCHRKLCRPVVSTGAANGATSSHITKCYLVALASRTIDMQYYYRNSNIHRCRCVALAAYKQARTVAYTQTHNSDNNVCVFVCAFRFCAFAFWPQAKVSCLSSSSSISILSSANHLRTPKNTHTYANNIRRAIFQFSTFTTARPKQKYTGAS